MSGRLFTLSAGTWCSHLTFLREVDAKHQRPWDKFNIYENPRFADNAFDVKPPDFS